MNLTNLVVFMLNLLQIILKILNINIPKLFEP